MSWIALLITANTRRVAFQRWTHAPVYNHSELILGMRPANERRRYKVTPSFIGWAQTSNQPCKLIAGNKWGANVSLQWRHNERYGVSNHQPNDCLSNRLFRRRSKKKPKLPVTGLCEGNSPVTREFPAQRSSNAKMFPFDDAIIWEWLSNAFIYTYILGDEQEIVRICMGHNIHTLRPRQNGRQFEENISKYFFQWQYLYIFICISLKNNPTHTCVTRP